MVYNEALILPYFLRHYSYLDEIHVLYETDSRDESLEILSRAPNVVIEECHIEGGLDDIDKINLINQVVRKIRADWLYVVDPDELIFPPFNESPYDFLKRQSCDVVRSGMFQVYRHRDDRDLDPSSDPIPQRIHGDPDLFATEPQSHRVPNYTYVKPNIVRPSKKIRFLPGQHRISWNPRVSAELYIGVHWQMADPSFAIARRMERKARVSERNRRHQWGWQHFDITVEKIMRECERHLDDPVIETLVSADAIRAPDPSVEPSKVRYFLRLPARALQVIRTEGWVGFRTRSEDWLRRIFAGEFGYASPGEGPDQMENREYAHFSEDADQATDNHEDAGRGLPRDQSRR